VLLKFIDQLRKCNGRLAVLTPSSRRRRGRHHRRLLCRRLHLPLRLLPRLAPVEGGHRQLPTDQKGPSRSILDVFCPCPNGTPRRPFGNLGYSHGSGAKNCSSGSAAERRLIKPYHRTSVYVRGEAYLAAGQEGEAFPGFCESDRTRRRFR